MFDDLNEQIGYQVQSTAEWRRRKQKNSLPRSWSASLRKSKSLRFESPRADSRNTRPAEIELAIATAMSGQTSSKPCPLRASLVGFPGSYARVAIPRMVPRTWLREEIFGNGSDEVVPAPDLNEQVADDPAVKAAKPRLDEAYAKSYAEARKKVVKWPL